MAFYEKYFGCVVGRKYRNQKRDSNRTSWSAA